MMIGALDAARRQVAEIDYALLWSVLILLFTGLVFVYSASIAIAEGGRTTGHQPAYYLIRQGIFLCIGLVAAAYTLRKINVMHDLKQAFLPMFGAMAVVGMLLLKEPDFGAFVVIISIAMAILFLGGLKARLFALLIVGLLIAFTVMIIVSPYRRDRVFGFMDPWANAFGRGYQLSHSLIAFGRGELFGVGLGGSVEKLFYLPEAHTDFLLAVIAEELGFFGVLAVIALFAVLVQRAFAIGRQ